MLPPAHLRCFSGQLAGHVEGLAEEREEEAKPRQVRLAAWTLLSDGVFSARTRTQRSAVELFRDDLSIRLMAHALTSDPETPSLAADRGGQQLAELLQGQLTEAPNSPLAPERITILAKLQDREEFDAWWQSRVRAAAGDPQQATWLRLGSPVQAASRLSSSDIDKLDLGEDGAALAVNAGVVPADGSELEQRMVRAVLDGQCSDADSSATSVAADILKVFAPQHHLRRGSKGDRAFSLEVGHLDRATQNRHQNSAMGRLAAHDPGFWKLRKALRFNKKQSGTTSPWGNSARAMSDIFGPCWIAAEAAVIGAALVVGFRTEVDTDPGGASEPFGPEADYGRLLDNVRFFRNDTQWWPDQFREHQDRLSRATWALALVAVAGERVVRTNLTNLATVVEELDTPAVEALLASSSRIGASGLARRLGTEILSAALSTSPVAGLLLAHHSASVDGLADLPQYSVDQLAQAATFGRHGWPALRAATARMMADPSPPVLSAIRRFGPSAVLPPLTVQWERNGHARSILTNTAEYPLAWVLAAEQHIAHSAEDEPLATVAEKNEWFAV